MCGIAGIIYQEAKTAQEIISICNFFSIELKHRGPDDVGFALIRENGAFELYKNDDSLASLQLPEISEAKGNFIGALIHRRLSIISPGLAGHQPMLSNSGNKILIYNGEIYNYKQLDSEFGFKNNSNTDSETLLNLIDNNIPNYSEKLNGFYAYLVWDKVENKLIVSKDENGVKPCFHYITEEYSLFCSESYAIRKFTKSKLKIDLRSYLYQGLYSDISAFQDIEFNTYQSNYNGFVTEIIGNEIAWSSEQNFDNEGSEHISFDASYFKKSIENRLMSEVPIGFAMSGGLDSSLIAAQARKILGEKIELHFFSVISNNPKFDESKWQKLMVDHCNAKWHCLDMETLGIEHIKSFIIKNKVPPIAWNNIAHFSLCQLAKESGVTVMFNGQGADELFGGYPEYLQRNVWRNFFKIFFKKNHFPISKFEMIKGNIKFLFKRLLNIGSFSLHPLEKYLSLPIKSAAKKSYMEKRALQSFTADQKMQFDFKYGKLQQMLYLEDLNGMAWSIESRNPFADDQLLTNWCHSNLTFENCIESGYTKSTLRAIGKDLLPEAINLRVDKKGFSVPDIELTLAHKNELMPYFLNTNINNIISEKQKQLLIRKLDAAHEKELQLFFRLCCLSMYYELIET